MIFPVNINYVVTLKENRIHLSSLGGTYSKFDNTNPLKFPPASKNSKLTKKHNCGTYVTKCKLKS
ncbi:hypothetical protein EAO24_16705 [Klebsiella pneumoniae]|nr:hypothetical protein EAO24_16705 [Klebsiella pneumoniae]